MSLEPSFPASAVVSSEDQAMQFLLKRKILRKGYDTTVLCRHCLEGCEVPVDGEAGERYFICPTGYMERPVPVTEDEVTVYRFNYTAFCDNFAKANGLRIWKERKSRARGVYSLANGKVLNRKIAAIYLRCIEVEEVNVLLPLLKGQIGCEKLIVMTPRTDEIDMSVREALISGNILVVSLSDLLGKRSFALQLGETVTDPKSRNAYCQIVTHQKGAWSDRNKYKLLVNEPEKYDMFIDGFTLSVTRRLLNGKISTDKLTLAEYAWLKECITSRRRVCPGEIGYSYKVFHAGRQKADVRLHDKEWRAFKTRSHLTAKAEPAYLFDPPRGFKYCLIIPIEANG